MAPEARVASTWCILSQNTTLRVSACMTVKQQKLGVTPRRTIVSWILLQ